jgi:hypothetical protein
MWCLCMHNDAYAYYLQMFNACLTLGCYSPSSLIKISSQDFELLTLVCENRSKPHVSNHPFPKWHLSHHDYSPTPCKLSPLDSESLYPCDPRFGLASPCILNPIQSWVPLVPLFLHGLVSISSIVTHETLKRSYSSHQATTICKLLLIFLPESDTVLRTSVQAFALLQTFAHPLSVKVSDRHDHPLWKQVISFSCQHNFSSETVRLSCAVG